jgi:glycosyltransferase involved in cell wall biosynthesis
VKIDLLSAHANPVAPPGSDDADGQAAHVASLAHGLAELGHEVRVLTRRDDPDAPARALLGDGVQVVHLDAGPPVRLGRDEVWDHVEQLTEQVGRCWDDGAPPDLVHAHAWTSGVTAVGAAAHHDVPVVLTYHAFGAEKLRHLGTLEATSPPERIGAEVQLSHDVDLVVSTTRKECRLHLAAGVAPTRLAYVPCGVDLDRFPPDRIAGRRQIGTVTAGAIGPLADHRGITDLFEALAEVPGVHLVVAGGEEAADRDPAAQRYQAIATAFGIAERVRFVGPVTAPEVAELLGHLDLVVCCPWYEPFGLVALEAMAAGIPVVATRVGGLAETVVHEVTGLHVPPRCAGDLAAAIASLAGDPDRRLRLGLAGRHRAQRYAWNRIARRTAAAYWDLLHRRMTGPRSETDPTGAARR